MKTSPLLVIVIAGAVLAGCRAPSGGSTPAASGLPRVLATETFLGDIAQNVAGNRLTVETLLRPGVDPHEFQPTPQDAIKIAQSQVLIVNGLGYETWLTKSLEAGGGQRLVIVASTGLTANPDPSGEHPDGDPHMWMNPLKVVQYVANIRDGLSKADPAGAAQYAANADTYAAQLKDLDQWIKGQLTQLPAERRLLVTNHDALGYFAEGYGFKVVGAVIPSVTNEASPSAKQMADLITTIKSSGAPAIFLDISENQNLANQIASESGARVVTDLYVETLSAAAGPAPTYIEMIKHDVSAIIQALK
jgi:zinc/manganese transport system substrate-binding protein